MTDACEKPQMAVAWAPKGTPPDFRMVLEALKVDTPDDAEWFRKNPEAYFRVRRASTHEKQAFHLPDDCQAFVLEVEPGEHVRYFRHAGRLLGKLASLKAAPKVKWNTEGDLP